MIKNNKKKDDSRTSLYYGKTFKRTIYEKDFKTIEVSVKDISN